MNFLKNLSVSKKLMLLIVVCAIALSSVGIVGLSYIQNMGKASAIMYHDNLVPLKTIMQIRINARASDAYTLELLTATDPKRIQELNDEISSAWQEIDDMITDLKNDPALFNEELKLFSEYDAHAKALSDSRNQVLSLIAENKQDEAYALYQKIIEDNRKLVNDTLKGLQAFNFENAGKIDALNDTNVKEAKYIVVAVIVVSLLVLLIIGFFIARMIIKPVRDVKALLLEAEKGDFTVKGDYRSKDELGELTKSFNKMSSKLQSVFRTVNESSLLVASSSEELSASAEQNSQVSEHVAQTVQDLALGADRQVDAIKDTADVISRMNEYTNVLTEHTTSMKNDALHATEVSNEGNHAIVNVNLQMKSISTNVDSLFEAVNSLDQRSSQIGEIVNVISGISSQTNLLALNAAIEAARAGEQGRGFAVVASEVRKLAEQSSKSTEQITELIRLIQVDTENTIRTMQKTSEEVKQGTNVVNHAGESFEKIEIAVGRVVKQIEDVVNGLMKMAEGIQHVNTSIVDVREVSLDTAGQGQTISGATEEQLASMEEITSSSQALASLADDLQKITSQFKV